MVIGVYLDIQKGFDCVRHHTLLDKLCKMGIRGNMYCLIKNYLMYRTQYVHYNDVVQALNKSNMEYLKDQYLGHYSLFYL